MDPRDVDLDKLERVRRENSDRYAALWSFITRDTIKTILYVFQDYEGEGVTYSVLVDYLDVSRTRAKKLSYELRDAGIVEIVDRGEAELSFADEEAGLLVRDVLSFLD